MGLRRSITRGGFRGCEPPPQVDSLEYRLQPLALPAALGECNREIVERPRETFLEPRGFRRGEPTLYRHGFLNGRQAVMIEPTSAKRRSRLNSAVASESSNCSRVLSASQAALAAAARGLCRFGMPTENSPGEGASAEPGSARLVIDWAASPRRGGNCGLVPTGNPIG
jgi:hypothetical protein